MISYFLLLSVFTVKIVALSDQEEICTVTLHLGAGWWPVVNGHFNLVFQSHVSKLSSTIFAVFISVRVFQQTSAMVA